MTRQPITDRLNAALEPSDDPRDEIAERYAESGELTQDALDWVGDHAHRDAALVDHIVAVFLASPEYATNLEDIADGYRGIA